VILFVITEKQYEPILISGVVMTFGGAPVFIFYSYMLLSSGDIFQRSTAEKDLENQHTQILQMTRSLVWPRFGERRFYEERASKLKLNSGRWGDGGWVYFA